MTARITREEAEGMFRNMLDSTGEYKNDDCSQWHFGKCEFYKIMDAIYGPKEMSIEEARATLDDFFTIKPGHSYHIKPNSREAKAMWVLMGGGK
jgi:hypothetical protein